MLSVVAFLGLQRSAKEIMGNDKGFSLFSFWIVDT